MKGDEDFVMFKRYFVWFGVKVINWDEMNIVWGVDF